MPWPGRPRAEAPIVEATPARGSVSLSPGPALALTLAGLLLGGLGLAITGAPLAVPGLALAALGGLCVGVVGVNLFSLRLGGRALSTTVTEGQELRLALTVRLPWLLGLGACQLEHPLLEEPLGLSLRTPRRVVLSARPERRGRLLLDPPAVRVVDPLGLVHGRHTGVGAVGELLVLPRLEPVRWLDPDALGRRAAPAWTAPSGEATELAGLRDYQPGTPATRIHWPALARGNGLLERVFESDSELTPLILVDARAESTAAGAAQLDAVVRAVGSLAHDLAGSAGVDLLFGAGASPVRIGASPDGWSAVHRALALLDPLPLGAAPPRWPAARDGVLIHACTRPELARAGGRWGGHRLTLMPRGAPVPRPVLEVAGCVAGLESELS